MLATPAVRKRNRKKDAMAKWSKGRIYNTRIILACICHGNATLQKLMRIAPKGLAAKNTPRRKGASAASPDKFSLKYDQRYRRVDDKKDFPKNVSSMLKTLSLQPTDYKAKQGYTSLEELDTIVQKFLALSA
jgi:hypothetical protein